MVLIDLFFDEIIFVVKLYNFLRVMVECIMGIDMCVRILFMM